MGRSSHTRINQLRIAAAATAALFVLFAICSVFFLAAHTDHNCHGDVCAVCSVGRTIHSLRGGMAALAIVLSLVAVCFAAPLWAFAHRLAATASLILLKVRIND